MKKRARRRPKLTSETAYPWPRLRRDFPPARQHMSHGAIAQLGERLDRTQEVAGSSPASSTSRSPACLERSTAASLLGSPLEPTCLGTGARVGSCVEGSHASETWAAMCALQRLSLNDSSHPHLHLLAAPRQAGGLLTPETTTVRPQGLDSPLSRFVKLPRADLHGQVRQPGVVRGEFKTKVGRNRRGQPVTIIVPVSTKSGG